MKKLIITSAVVLYFGITAFIKRENNGNENGKDSVNHADADTSKPLSFTIKGKYERPVKKEDLDKCKSLSEIIEYYPVNWITTYDSVEILATCNGKAVRAMSKNEALSNEQINTLKTIDVNANLSINVWYKFRNDFNSYILENHEMHVKMTVVPEIEAEYIGGYEEMEKYLQVNAIDKISRSVTKQFQRSMVIFTINEQGEATEANISRSSGEAKTDKLLLDAINKMPKWKPAENLKGIKVKQKFVFTVDDGMGGC